MKYVKPSPYADPEAAARKLVEIANTIEPAQDGRIFIEQINAPMLYEHKATPADTRRGLIWRLRRDGWCCTRAGRLYASPRTVRICSRKSELAEPQRIVFAAAAPPAQSGCHQKAPGSAVRSLGLYRRA